MVRLQADGQFSVIYFYISAIFRFGPLYGICNISSEAWTDAWSEATKIKTIRNYE